MNCERIVYPCEKCIELPTEAPENGLEGAIQDCAICHEDEETSGAGRRRRAIVSRSGRGGRSGRKTGTRYGRRD
jgi:hypothetical protein